MVSRGAGYVGSIFGELLGKEMKVVRLCWLYLYYCSTALKKINAAPRLCDDLPSPSLIAVHKGPAHAASLSWLRVAMRVLVVDKSWRRKSCHVT